MILNRFLAYTIFFSVLILAFAGCGGNRGEMPATYSRYETQAAPRSITTQVSDKVLALKVRSKLRSDALVDAASLDVEVMHGIVRLTGTVDSVDTARMAADLVRAMKGVTRVENRIQVKY